MTKEDITGIAYGVGVVAFAYCAWSFARDTADRRLPLWGRGLFGVAAVVSGFFSAALMWELIGP